MNNFSLCENPIVKLLCLIDIFEKTLFYKYFDDIIINLLMMLSSQPRLTAAPP